MNIPFTDLHSQYLEAKASIDSAIQDCINRNSFITGPDVTHFEKTISEYVGAEDCASTGSGTMALQVALKSIELNPGDEVITVSHTFVSTVEAIINVGATPVMIDIDDYYLIDVDLIEKNISNKTKAILFVDLLGQTPDIEKLKEIANRHNLYLIADAAQSFGAKYKNSRVGSLVDLTCVSFNPVKNLGAMGDAGCVTGRKDLIERARMYRDHGRNTKFVFETVGYNARIDNIQAAVVLAKLPYLDSWLEKRREICHRYNKELKNIVVIPKTMPNNEHSFHVYCIETDRRDDLRKFLDDSGIKTNIHYPIPCHMQPAFEYLNTPVLEKTEQSVSRILSLPCYHSLTNDQQTYIIDKIKEWKSKQ